MAKSTIYTLTGDKGTTSLIGGTRIKKSDLRLETYGTVDELNSQIGVLMATNGVPSDTVDYLQSIQSRLFDIGAYLATEVLPDTEPKISGLDIADLNRLEDKIDGIDSELPKLRCFVLPSGTMAAAQAHVCRTVCRRAERLVVALADTSFVDPLVMSFLNRMSDYFFVLARYLNVIQNAPEIAWRKD